SPELDPQRPSFTRQPFAGIPSARVSIAIALWYCRLARMPCATSKYFYPRGEHMVTREEVRKLALEAKERLGLTWARLGEANSRHPVYAAFLVYGYGQAHAEEAQGLARALSLPPEAQAALCKAPHRTPAQPWPPTDPFIYRLYEIVMLYGPAFKDVAHE